MYSTLRRHHVSVAQLFRDAAAACGGSLVVCWLGLLGLEVNRTGAWIPNVQSLNQALVLAVVFASYAIGWRHELLGAVVAILGTVLFFTVGYASVGISPPLPAAWLATPGVLYLLAWIFGGREHGAG